jgi:DNA invertase Pin-like site-specific DNA recombinase
MATVGYARVSTEEQNLDLQKNALRAAGCETIFEDPGISAIALKRPGFEAALAALHAGDTLVVWKIDRAFRSLRQALDTMERLQNAKVSFRSLTETIDTSTPMGEAMYQIQNVFAQLERRLISERTKAGLEAARKRGKRLGRPPKLSPMQIASAIATLESDSSKGICELAKELHVSPRTLQRAVVFVTETKQQDGFSQVPDHRA